MIKSTTDPSSSLVPSVMSHKRRRRRHVHVAVTTIFLLVLLPGSAWSSKNSPSARGRNNNHQHPLMEALQTRLLSKRSTTSSTPNPFATRKPTRVTGYGSRQYYRQLRQQQHGTTAPANTKSPTTSKKKKHKKKAKKDATSSTRTTRSLLLYSTMDESTNTTTWMVRDEQSRQTLRLGVDLQVLMEEQDTTTRTREGEEAQRSVQGLWGVYTLPMGHLWVWITDSEAVFEQQHDDDHPNQHQHHPCATWFPLRRVTEVYLHLIPFSDQQQRAQSSSNSMIQRQVGLLRQALKDHEWYYCEDESDSLSTNRFVMTDATYNLQHCLERYQNQKNDHTPHTSSLSTCWWKQEDDMTRNPWYPDSRFFWNEGVLEPLLQKANRQTETEQDNPYQTLVSWSIPVTSAFVGIQSNLSLIEVSTSTASTSAKDSTTNTTSDDHNNTYHQILISRRSKWRAGTRFTKRGADATGHVANYAETEQIVVVEKQSSNHSANGTTPSQSVCSHVQTRGSIPLRWSSPTDIKTYRPRVRIGTDPLAQARAMRQHLVDQIGRYIYDKDMDSNCDTTSTDGHEYTCPRFVLVNLVDKHGDQGRLGRAMDSVMQAILDVHEKQQQDLASIQIEQDDNASSETTEQIDEETDEVDLSPTEDEEGSVSFEDTPVEYKHLNTKTIRHEWFDFHAEVKGGRWDRLRSLLDTVEPSLEEQGFLETFFDGADWKVKRLQTGIVRTNCMDCLDRTNVVQSIFARRMLFAQLQAATTISKRHTKSFDLNPLSLPWNGGEVAHRLLWADNADTISRLYAGTPALKGDFTRTGKRTKKGALDDGVNSIQRYYLNNFLDADRQEGMDLLTRHEEFTDFLSDNEKGSSTPTSKQKSLNGMSIQDAARDILLGGTWESLMDSKKSGNGDGDDDESDHIRAKLGGDHNRGGAFNKNGSSLLNFSWLPGDLQSQMRSLAAMHTPLSSAQQDQESVLKSMDDRTAQDVPWWAMGADESTSDEDSRNVPSPVSSVNKGDLESSVDANHAGFVLAALVAGTKAPLATAAMVLGIAGLSLTKPLEIVDDFSDGEDEH